MSPLMTPNAFDSAKAILAHAHQARPCILNAKDEEGLPPEGMLVECDITNSAALPLLEAAIHRVHPEANLITVTSHSGVVFCFPPKFKDLPIQQIGQQLRLLERDIAGCITGPNDGSYIITRDPKMHPLDLHDFLGDVASEYYRREMPTASRMADDPNSIPRFDATAHFKLPKGEVLIDDNGVRRTKLNTRQAMDYIYKCKEQGKMEYDLGSLLDHVELGPTAAKEVLNTLGMLPSKNAASRWEIN